MNRTKTDSQQELPATEIAALPATEAIAVLNRLNDAQRARTIFALPNPETFVQSLPLADFIRFLHDADSSHAADLLPLASPEQVQLLLDLELWEEWSIIMEETQKWLEIILAAGNEQAAGLLAQLDPELMLLFLKKTVTVGGGLAEIINSEDFQQEWDHTFDEIFYLKLHDEELGATALKLLELLYTEDHPLYRALMLGVESEILSELEELAWQFRCGRLADAGLPETTTATSLLADGSGARQ